jgi:hypothetical protein
LWILACVAVLIVPVAVFAGSDRGFNGVVNSIEGRYHVHATRIPLMSLVSLVAHKTTNGGVSGVRIAEFDNFSAYVDRDELNAMVAQNLGSGWERMIRETSSKGKEQTLIFAHPEGNRMGLFVVDLDGRELDVVQVSVDPGHLHATIDKYSHKMENDEVEGQPDLEPVERPSAN